MAKTPDWKQKPYLEKLKFKDKQGYSKRAREKENEVQTGQRKV